MLSKRQAPSAEAFAAWYDDPITRFVLEACGKAAGECRESWSEKAWASGEADQVELIVARTRADAYDALRDTDYLGWCATMGVEPIYENK